MPHPVLTSSNEPGCTISPRVDIIQPQTRYPGNNVFPIVPNNHTDAGSTATRRSYSPKLVIDSEPRSNRLLQASPFRPADVKPLLIPFKDPLENLPAELWILCIQFALGNCSVDGPLLYAGVSTNWRAKLLETPILWNEICLVNGEDEDARVATFLQLSGQAPLTVEILAPIHDFTPLNRILERSFRIENLSFNPYHQSAIKERSALDAAWSGTLHSMLPWMMRPGIAYNSLKHINGTGILTISQAMMLIWAFPNATFGSYRGSNTLPAVPLPFKSRPNLEHKMAEVLLNIPSRKRRLLLPGSPKSGKTSMAAYFMQKYRNMFSFVLFVDASSERSIQRGLISAAEPLGLRTSSNWGQVLHALTAKENPFIIYDNILEPELLEKYMLPRGYGTILAISYYLPEDEWVKRHWFSIVHFDRVVFGIDRDQSSAIPAREPPLSSNVYFETLVFPRARPLALQGSILVKDIAFDKSVALRFTFDYWRTTSEVLCKYVCAVPTLPSPFPLEDPSPGIRTPSWVRFSFRIHIDEEMNLENRWLFLAARYHVPGFGEWWDNNDANNYGVVFKIIEVPWDNPTTTNKTPSGPLSLQQSGGF